MEDKINICSDFSDFIRVFLEENSKLNLISRNDEKFLYEKHIYDSLGIKLFLNKRNVNGNSLLDIGCGGGFPCVPIAIEYPNLRVTGIDSIRKKILAVENIKNKLGLTNLDLICDRVENLQNKKFDLIVSRAVGDLSKILKYAIPLLKKDGYFIAYKSKKSEEEIQNAKSTLKALGANIADTLDYVLPTKEQHQRVLICVKRN